jgi:glycosyltransferase involved in cell wall biosynthesis
MNDHVQVWILDLMTIVPYYTGHLCATLQEDQRLKTKLVSTTYRHDPDFFRSRNVKCELVLIDMSSRFRRAPEGARRFIKAVEYLVNFTWIICRALVSRPSIVHIQFLPLISHGVSLELWYVAALQLLGCRVVYTVHNLLPQDTGSRFKTLYCRLYRKVDRLICHDAHCAGRLSAEFGVPTEEISIIPHGPLFTAEPRSSREYARAQLDLRTDDFIVLWQGILRPYKGVSFLLRVWQQVCVKRPSAKLIIAGTGAPELLTNLQSEVAALGLENSVRLILRFVSVSELVELYDAADVVVFPYSEVTTSGAVMTAITAGKAILASTLPPFQALLRHGENALLESYGDTAQWAGILLQLANDSGLGKQLGQQLKADHAHFTSWDTIASLTSKCYRAALDEQAHWRIRTITP